MENCKIKTCPKIALKLFAWGKVDDLMEANERNGMGTFSYFAYMYGNDLLHASLDQYMMNYKRCTAMLYYVLND